MHILMIRLSALGDILRTLPALHALRRAFPRARIVWAAQDMARSLLDGHPEVDEWLYFPRRGGWGEWTEFLRNLRAREYGLALDFHGRLMSALVLRAARGARKVGLAPPGSREGARFFYREAVSCDTLNRVEQTFCLLKHVGAEPLAEWTLPLRPDARAWAEEAVGPLGERRIAFFFPGASTRRYGARKRWSEEGFAELGRRLLAAFGDTAVVVGHGPGEEDLARRIVSRIGEGAHLGPPTTLPQLAALIARCALYVGGDTGPTHLAWLLRVPTVALYPASPPERSTPPFDLPYRAVPLSRAAPLGEAVASVEQAARSLLGH
jgi:ADP-heptose:LPS heptosyltransferase